MLKRGVSFYSYQNEWNAGRMDLEACVRAVAELGADGIELLAVQTPPTTYPNPTPAEGEAWWALMEKYHTKPVCFDSLIRAQDMTLEEQTCRMRDEITYCKELGFHIMRSPMLYGLSRDAIERNMDYAAQCDVNISIEVHVPMVLGGPEVETYLEWAERIGTKHAGIIPDAAIFSVKLPAPLLRCARLHGAEQEEIEAVEAAFAAKLPLDELGGKLPERHRTQGLEELLRWATRCKTCPPEQMRDFAPYITHVHGKFYEVDETGVERGIPYDRIVKTLKEIGYTGYLNSEFEGQKVNAPEDPIDELEQVRRQHRMLERYWNQA